MLIPFDSRRVRLVSEGDEKPGPVVYWMSREQRVHDNWALIVAQAAALERRKPLKVVFSLTADFLGANLRHYAFLLQGLREVRKKLAALNITFSLLTGDPPVVLAKYIRRIEAAILFTDSDPLIIKKNWRKSVARAISIPFHEVDAHNIVPVWHASAKREFAAYTIRPKIKKMLDQFMIEFPALLRHPFREDDAADNFDMDRFLQQIRDKSVPEVAWITPGETAAKKALRNFVHKALAAYPHNRNNPCLQGQSNLSPYLHFGQLAPQRAALEVVAAEASEEAKSVFLEELIIRRELADNFCHFTPAYDRTEGFPKWAQDTLNAHRNDPRQYTYSLEALENGQTHDPLWNACQLDLKTRAKLHGYLRMYWAKKILEWTATQEEALQYAITLNDKYSLDGRDPNGYTGIAWCIGGVHDRAWPERPVFGKIRFMSYAGCRRKFNVEKYIRNVEKIK